MAGEFAVLVVASAEGVRLDAGSVGLAVARLWSEADNPVVFVDGDASGSGLAARFGAVENADYSPAARGLPSLIVAREPLTLRLLAEHCYSLSTSAGSLWALFGPRHPGGAAVAARWLAQRRGDLLEIDARRRVVVSSSLGVGGERTAPVVRAAPVVAVVAAVESVEQARALGAQCRADGSEGARRRRRVLIVEDGSPLVDGEIEAAAGMRIAGRLPVIDDEKVLRLQGGRRERAFVKSLKRIAERLLALSDDVAASSARADADALAEADRRADADALEHADALAGRLDGVGVRADAEALAEALAAAQADADALVEAHARSEADGSGTAPNGRPDGRAAPVVDDSALLWPVERVGEVGREGRV